MNIFDLMIIFALIFGIFMGWKRGFLRVVVSIVGLILVIALSFLLKNPISEVFYRYLPFINYGGSFSGVSSINIVVYELVAFIITFAILLTGYRITIGTTKIIDKIINSTQILKPHSKILGAIFGVIDSYIVTFIVLYILSLPLFNIELLNESWMANNMLDNTPVLSYVIDDKLSLYDEIKELKIQYVEQKDKVEFDRKLLKLLVKHKVISNDNVERLVERKKLKPELIENEKKGD